MIVDLLPHNLRAYYPKLKQSSFLQTNELQEHKCRLSSQQQVYVQHNQIEQQKSEYSQQSSRYPRQNYFDQNTTLTVINICTIDSDVYYNYNEIGESGEDADKEVLVVALSHTIIEPNAVVIEIIHTTVTGTAVFACRQAVAVTEVAEQYFAVVRGESSVLIVE